MKPISSTRVTLTFGLLVLSSRRLSVFWLFWGLSSFVGSRCLTIQNRRALSSVLWEKYFGNPQRLTSNQLGLACRTMVDHLFSKLDLCSMLRDDLIFSMLRQFHGLNDIQIANWFQHANRQIAEDEWSEVIFSLSDAYRVCRSPLFRWEICVLSFSNCHVGRSVDPKNQI